MTRGPWSRLRRESGWQRHGLPPGSPPPGMKPPRRALARRLRHAAIWLALGLVLAIGYSYRFELSDVVDRLGGELIPYAAVTTEDGGLRVRAHSDGHFYVKALADGREIRFLVDTGASVVALSPADADSLGLDRTRLNYSRRLHTAGGMVRAAPVLIRTLELGDIRLSQRAGAGQRGADAVLPARRQRPRTPRRLRGPRRDAHAEAVRTRLSKTLLARPYNLTFLLNEFGCQTTKQLSNQLKIS